MPASQRLMLRRKSELHSFGLRLPGEEEGTVTPADDGRKGFSANHQIAKADCDGCCTDQILSDYIQLKLELAELQGKLQFVEADAKHKIQDLENKNELLQRENAEILETNRVLREENERLNRRKWLGGRRRASLQESSQPSCRLEIVRRTTSLQDTMPPIRDAPCVCTTQMKTKKVTSNRSEPPQNKTQESTTSAHRTKEKTTSKTPNVANDHELYKQIYLRQNCEASARRDKASIQLHREEKPTQRNSNTSTSETSCETSLAPPSDNAPVPSDRVLSPGGEFCFSIQAESISSDYCEYSVVDPGETSLA